MGAAAGALAGRMGAAVIGALAASWRVRVEGEAAAEAARLRVGWHASWLVAAGCLRDRGLVIGISRSRDGDRAAAVLRRLGYGEPVRGSTSRGGPALLHGLVRRLRAGQPVGILPDGPRGPARRAQAGGVHLARLAGVPITPVGVAARPALRLRSWDRTLLPMPFARVVLRVGAPIPVARDADDAEVERIRRQLGEALDRLTREARGTLDSAAVGRASAEEVR